MSLDPLGNPIITKDAGAANPVNQTNFTGKKDPLGNPIIGGSNTPNPTHETIDSPAWVNWVYDVTSPSGVEDPKKASVKPFKEAFGNLKESFGKGELFQDDIRKNWKPSLVESLDKRQGEIDKSVNDFMKGDIGYSETATQVLGKTVGGAFDVLGEVVDSALTGWELLIPDSIDQPVIDKTKESLNWLMNTDKGEELANLIGGTMDDYQGWKDNNPQDAKTLESVANISFMFAPVKAKAKAGPTPVIRTAADKLDDIATKETTDLKRNFVERLIRPVPTPASRAEEVKRSIVNKWGTTKITPSKTQEAIIEEVMKVPKIKFGNSHQGNYNLIVAKRDELGDQLQSLVRQYDQPIHPRTPGNAIDDAVATMNQRNPLISGDAEQVGIKIAIEAKRLINENPHTASGLLAARKQLDNWVKTQKGDAAFTDSTTALTIANREIRESMTNTLEQVMANAPVKVKDRLTEQFRLFQAADIVEAKAAKEAATKIGRIWQNTARVLPLKAQFNRDLAVLLGIGAFGASSVMMPWLAGSLAVTGAGALLWKGATSPELKKGIALLLGKTDQAIKASRNSDMIRQLRLDRAFLIDSLKTMETEDTEVPYRTETSPKNLPEAQQ